MCGIAGVYGHFDAALLPRMSAVLAHRGPDDHGIYTDPAAGIGLAHRRLAILDLSPAGHQPMWDLAGRAVITFNGEIYNYRELRAELLADGFTFTSQSDTEVLLNLYLRDGERMLARLNGIFAFAIWHPERRTLLVARDGLGVKPLYYHASSHGFLFASELKALLCAPELERRLNPEAAHYHMSFLWCPAPRTMLQGVHKLEPGHYLEVHDGAVATRRCFYDLPYTAPASRRSTLSPADAARQVARAVARAVERQMVADVPVGAFLSGGLDSSAVVAFAREHVSHGRLPCFTIGFSPEAGRQEDFGLDEAYARRVAAHLDVELHTVRVGPEMAGRLEQAIWLLDEPQADPAPVNAWLIAELARAHGIKVLLSGAGGDDIFSGYRRHYALTQERLWRWLPQRARDLLHRAALALPQSSAPGRRLNRAFQYAALDPESRLCGYFLWSDPDTLAGLYGPRMREHAARLDAFAPLRQTLARLPPGVDPLDRMLYLEGKHFLADHNLNYLDRMSMAAGVEARVPLLDRALVALAATLPAGMKQRGRTGKWIFKKAMEPYLPHDVIYRPKIGFGAPFRHWIRHELRPLVDDVLSESSLRARGLFDPARVRELRRRDDRGENDHAYTLFAILCMELWCRRFLDSAPTP